VTFENYARFRKGIYPSLQTTFDETPKTFTQRVRKRTHKTQKRTQTTSNPATKAKGTQFWDGNFHKGHKKGTYPEP
jgi:hypothetical protein